MFPLDLTNPAFAGTTVGPAYAAPAADDWFSRTGAELGIDPAHLQGGVDPARMGGNTGFTGGADVLQGGPYKKMPVYRDAADEASRTTPQATLEQAPNNQQTIDNFWSAITQSGRTSLSPQELQAIVAQHPGISFLPGSSDKVRLPNGQVVDPIGDVGGANKPQWAISGGQPGENGQPLTAAASGSGGGGAPAGVGGGGGGGYPTGPMPAAPTATTLDAPAPFVAPGLGQLGSFQGPAAAATPTPFVAPSSVPTPGQVSYTNAAAPATLTAQQVATPQALTFNPSATPTAFAGSRQAAPATLSYENLPTPASYAHTDYTGLTEAQLRADPSYTWRLKQGQELLENSAASKGMARSGATAKALIEYGQGAASQEYAAADARARATNTSNNAGQLGAYQTNAQTGLSYDQNRNANAFTFGNANITNAERANSDNYDRASTEAQQGFANRNQVEQQNNAGGMAAAAGNNAAQLGQIQANNASTLAFGKQNFDAGFAVDQANQAGRTAATTTNNAANAGAQAAQYGQAANTYGLNTTTQQAAQAQQYGQASNTYGQNLAAQQQGYAQQLGAYSTNTGTALAYNQNANTNALNHYTAATNAALGFGNLGLGYQNSNNQFALGQGQLGVAQGQLGLATQGQQFNQDLSTFNTNYQTQVVDPWTRNYQTAVLGNPGAPNGQANANAQSDLITQRGNANAAGQVGAGNAWSTGVAGATNTGVQLGMYYNPPPPTYQPGYGQPLYRT